MILYFSGTGNSKYAAQRIAADLARQIVDDVVSYPYNKR